MCNNKSLRVRVVDRSAAHQGCLKRSFDQMQRVGFLQHQKNLIGSIGTTFYGRSQQRDCVTSNRAQVVRSYTLCVRYWRTNQSLRTLHRTPCEAAHLPRVAFTVLPCPSRTPVSEIVCTATLTAALPRLVRPLSLSPSTACSLLSNSRPFHCVSCRSLWRGNDLCSPSLPGFLRMCMIQS